MEMKCCKSHGKKPTLRYFSTSFPSIGILGFFPVTCNKGDFYEETLRLTEWNGTME